VQAVQPPAGGGVDAQVADLDQHTTEELGLLGDLQLDRRARQIGHLLGQPLLAIRVDRAGGVHACDPPAPCLGRAQHEPVDRPTKSRVRRPSR